MAFQLVPEDAILSRTLARPAIVARVQDAALHVIHGQEHYQVINLKPLDVLVADDRFLEDAPQGDPDQEEEGSAPVEATLSPHARPVDAWRPRNMRLSLQKAAPLGPVLQVVVDEVDDVAEEALGPVRVDQQLRDRLLVPLDPRQMNCPRGRLAAWGAHVAELLLRCLRQDPSRHPYSIDPAGEQRRNSNPGKKPAQGERPGETEIGPPEGHVSGPWT
eukprot:1324841-Pyramimonas_sp.AAC.2